MPGRRLLPPSACAPSRTARQASRRPADACCTRACGESGRAYAQPRGARRSDLACV